MHAASIDLQIAKIEAQNARFIDEMTPYKKEWYESDDVKHCASANDFVNRIGTDTDLFVPGNAVKVSSLHTSSCP